MEILVVQNRMGMGDLIIFMPFIEAISKKYKVPITCLVKKNSKANEIFQDSEFIKEFIFLEITTGTSNTPGTIIVLNFLIPLFFKTFEAPANKSFEIFG